MPINENTMYCDSGLMVNGKDITLVKDDECNLLQVLVPMNRMKTMFGDQYQMSPGDNDTVLEIGCEIKSINKVKMGPITSL